MQWHPQHYVLFGRTYLIPEGSILSVYRNINNLKLKCILNVIRFSRWYFQGL